jgi:hypothetical protein
VLNEVSGKDKADAIEPPEESDHKVKMESTPKPRSPPPTKPNLKKAQVRKNSSRLK